MKAILLLIITTSIFGMDYKSFKEKALNETNILKRAELSIDIVKKESQILQRLENPSLEFAGSRFESKKGWNIGLSQPIRAFGLGSDLKDLGDAKEIESKADLLTAKALFCKELEIRYIRYVFQKELELLIHDELNLAVRLEEITKERLQNGVGTKVQFLMSILEKDDVQNRLKEQKLYINLRYFDLLSFANITEEIDIEAKFIYPFKKQQKVTSSSNPQLLKATKQHERLVIESKSLDHSIKSINIFGEYEKEPDQKIQRVGIELTLPLFNTSLQEVQLSKIKAKQHAYLIKELQIKQQLNVKRIQSTLVNLDEQYRALQTQEKKQFKLLQLFQEGYKISKGSILEIIDVKNRLITNKRKLLQIQKDSNLQQIELNFIQGKYND